MYTYFKVSNLMCSDVNYQTQIIKHVSFAHNSQIGAVEPLKYAAQNNATRYKKSTIRSVWLLNRGTRGKKLDTLLIGIPSKCPR